MFSNFISGMNLLKEFKVLFKVLNTEMYLPVHLLLGRLASIEEGRAGK